MKNIEMNMNPKFREILTHVYETPKNPDEEQHSYYVATRIPSDLDSEMLEKIWISSLYRESERRFDEIHVMDTQILMYPTVKDLFEPIFSHRRHLIVTDELDNRDAIENLVYHSGEFENGTLSKFFWFDPNRPHSHEKCRTKSVTWTIYPTIEELIRLNPKMSYLYAFDLGEDVYYFRKSRGLKVA